MVLGVEEQNRLMTLAAFVVLKPGTAPDAGTVRALHDYVKSALTAYKYPRRVRFLDALPKTGTDKIDRQALKRLASDTFPFLARRH
jgi:acyl-coenzyme A synthetase/AMP-(fatty) acid ligase